MEPAVTTATDDSVLEMQFFERCTKDALQAWLDARDSGYSKVTGVKYHGPRSITATIEMHIPEERAMEAFRCWLDKMGAGHYTVTEFKAADPLAVSVGVVRAK